MGTASEHNIYIVPQISRSCTRIACDRVIRRSLAKNAFRVLAHETFDVSTTNIAFIAFFANENERARARAHSSSSPFRSGGRTRDVRVDQTRATNVRLLNNSKGTGGICTAGPLVSCQIYHFRQLTGRNSVRHRTPTTLKQPNCRPARDDDIVFRRRFINNSTASVYTRSLFGPRTKNANYERNTRVHTCGYFHRNIIQTTSVRNGDRPRRGSAGRSCRTHRLRSRTDDRRKTDETSRIRTYAKHD